MRNDSVRPQTDIHPAQWCYGGRTDEHIYEPSERLFPLMQQLVYFGNWRSNSACEPIHAQAWVCGVLAEFFEGSAGGLPDLRWQTVIQSPEFCRAMRGHFLLRRDLSFSARKFSGDCECSASSLSSREDNAGRGAASFKMASQPSAGNSPGHSAGMSCTSWRRALAGNLAMASSISSSDFTTEKCASGTRLSIAKRNSNDFPHPS